MTWGKISDKDMQHCHFLKSTCDIGDPHQGPQCMIKHTQVGKVAWGGGGVAGDFFYWGVVGEWGGD